MSAMIPLPSPPGGRKQPNRSRPKKPRPPSPSHLPTNGGRGEGRPRENPCVGHPPSLLSGHAPQKEGGVTEGEAQVVRLPKKPRRRKKRKVEPEGRVTIPPAETEDYRRMKNFSLHPRPFHNTMYTSHKTHTNTSHIVCGTSIYG